MPAAPTDPEDGDGDALSDGSPSVELELYDLSVRVDGGPDGDLETVHDRATDLMDYLVDRHYDLEKGPDDRDRF